MVLNATARDHQLLAGVGVHLLPTVGGEKGFSVLPRSEFFSRRKKEAENVEEFTKRFNNLYHKIPSMIQPIETTSMVAYSAAFEPDFVVALWERRSITLLLMQADAVALEGNLLAAGKIKCTGNQWPEEKRKKKKDKKKRKNDPKPSTSVKDSPEVKIEEMSRIIRNLSNKITRLEVKGQTLGRF